MSFFNLGKKAKKVAAAADPGPAPAPVALPTPADPSIREQELNEEKKAAKRKGRSSTLMSGQLGDALPAEPKVSRPILGGY